MAIASGAWPRFQSRLPIVLGHKRFWRSAHPSSVISERRRWRFRRGGLPRRTERGLMETFPSPRRNARNVRIVELATQPTRARLGVRPSAPTAARVRPDEWCRLARLAGNEKIGFCCGGRKCGCEATMVTTSAAHAAGDGRLCDSSLRGPKGPAESVLRVRRGASFRSRDGLSNSHVAQPLDERVGQAVVVSGVHGHAPVPWCATCARWKKLLREALAPLLQGRPSAPVALKPWHRPPHVTIPSAIEGPRRQARNSAGSAASPVSEDAGGTWSPRADDHNRGGV